MHHTQKEKKKTAYLLNLGAVAEGLVDNLLEVDNLAAAHALVGRDDVRRVGVVDALGQAVGAEAGENHTVFVFLCVKRGKVSMMPVCTQRCVWCFVSFLQCKLEDARCWHGDRQSTTEVARNCPEVSSTRCKTIRLISTRDSKFYFPRLPLRMLAHWQ